MKKIITCLLMTAILISSVILPAHASEITDDVMITKTLNNGTEIQVHSNPYISDGITELEFKIIEKIRETATAIGFDINTDTEYQFYEEMIYKNLFYCGNIAPISAEQLDGIFTIIENSGQMLKAKTEGKTPSEGTISEGFYAGVTEEEREAIRQEVFMDYADEEIKKLGILNLRAGFGPYTSVFHWQPSLFFRCNKANVAGENYLVEAIADVNQVTYDSMAGYFDGSYSMAEVKTYPENNQLLSKVTVGLETGYEPNEANNMGIFLLKYDGTVERLDIREGEYFHGQSYLFDIDECGYIAWGDVKDTSNQNNTPPTTNQNNTPPTTPPANNSGSNNGKVTAPQTADTAAPELAAVMLFAAITILVVNKKILKTQ